MSAHTQLSYVYPRRHTSDKMYQALLARNEAKTEMVVPCEYNHVYAGGRKQQL